MATVDELRKKVGLPPINEPVAKAAATPTRRRKATAHMPNDRRVRGRARKGSAEWRAIQRRRADFVIEAGLNQPPPVPAPLLPQTQKALERNTLAALLGDELAKAVAVQGWYVSLRGSDFFHLNTTEGATTLVDVDEIEAAGWELTNGEMLPGTTKSWLYFKRAA